MNIMGVVMSFMTKGSSRDDLVSNKTILSPSRHDNEEAVPSMIIHFRKSDAS